MRIELAEGSFIEVDAGDDASAVAEALSKTAVAVAAAKQAGKESHFTAFEAERDMDGGTAAEILDWYLEGGIHLVTDKFLANDWDRTPEEDFPHWTKDKLAKALLPLAEDACEAMETEFGDSPEPHDVAEECADILKETTCEAMADADESSVTDAIPPHVVVEMAFLPDGDRLGIDDMHMSHWDVVFSAETAICDSNLIRFLKFMNVSPREFIDACRERGFDPSAADAVEGRSGYRQQQAEENALRWRAVLEAQEGGDENIRLLPLRSKGEIAEWNLTVDLVRSCRDYDRPNAVSMDDLFTIMDNATYGGNATWVARLPLREVLKGTYDAPFKAKGGFIGIHDFINGSGYIERLGEEVVIDPSKGRFRGPKSGRYSIDDVYGIVGSHYRAETVPVEVDGWIRYRPDTWRKATDDGRVVLVSRNVAEDGNEEFWVLTTDDEGNLAGPRQTSEVWTDIKAAKADGDAALAAEWAAGPNP